MTNELRNEPETQTEARRLIDLGYHLVPIEYGSKRPLIAWKESASSFRTLDEWLARFGRRLNVAIHAGKSGVIVLDADTAEAARWIHSHCPPTPMTAATPRGGLHAYYQAPDDATAPMQDLFGIGLDVKAGASLIVSSPSWSRGHGKRWAWQGTAVPPAELPMLPSDLIRREPYQKPTFRNCGHVRRPCGGAIRDVTRWIMEVESIQGSGGSNQCFRVACRLVDAGLCWQEALGWLRRWNERKAVPPWSQRELCHKLRDAFGRT